MLDGFSIQRGGPSSSFFIIYLPGRRLFTHPPCVISLRRCPLSLALLFILFPGLSACAGRPSAATATASRQAATGARLSESPGRALAGPPPSSRHRGADGRRSVLLSMRRRHWLE